MSKYIRLDEATDLLRGIDATMTGEFVADLLESLPTIEIVHCGECKHRNTANCPMIWFDVRFEGYRPGDFDNYFCSDGERKDNE